MNATPAENKQFIGRYLQALSGRPKPPDLVARFVADPHLAAHIHDAEAGFPEYELLADEVMAERDLVAIRGRFEGVHRGSFAGIAATGRSVSAPLMIIYRVADGRIVEHWMQLDGASLFSQLQEAAATARA